ncbi:MAG: transporter related, partial [Herbinix sp.]|nr:transporter related [Herbinix sp.]
SGKSTLLYSLSGMDRPTLGSIQYSGEEISGYSNDKLAKFRRKKCGFIFQQNYLNDTMTVMDNIMVSGLLVNKDRKAIDRKGKELLGKLNLGPDCYHKYPAQLSGGEAQRVAVVRALINSPEIVFADEPTGALNSQNANDVLDIFTKINEEGQSIVMVTHDIKSARRGSRILYLQDGVIVDSLQLGKYKPGDVERHEKLNVFLKKMGW